MTIDEQKLEAFVHQAIGDLGAPGAIRYTVPGMMSPVDPSSCWMCRLPDTTYPTCSTWHESVPTTGLMHVDQRQPGWNVNRPTSPSPTLTTSTVAHSGRRTSSGVEKSLISTPAMSRLLSDRKTSRPKARHRRHIGCSGPAPKTSESPFDRLGGAVAARGAGGDGLGQVGAEFGVALLDPPQAVADPGSDRLAGPLAAPAEEAGPSPQADGSGQLLGQQLPFQPGPGLPLQVMVGFGFSEVFVEFPQPGPVFGPGPVVEDRVGPERRLPGGFFAGLDPEEGGGAHRLTGRAEQHSDVPQALGVLQE